MEHIIHAFGIDWRLIVIQIVNFTILLFALWYFLYTPILKILSDREQKIKEGIQNAEKAQESLNNAETERQRVLAKARTDADNIVNQAQIHADAKRDEIINEAEAHAAHMIDAAILQSEELKRKARRASEAEIAGAAVLAAEQIISEKLGS
jgi:F-type H+-transporting ATPase subunit b